jgi:translocation and assembly module TamB
MLLGLGGFLVILLLIAAALAFTLNTHAGTRWLINNVDARIPGAIGIEQFTGTLWAGLRIPVADYQDAGMEVHVVDAELRIDWSSLSLGRAVMSVLSARSVEYRNLVADEVPVTAKPAAKPFELEIASLPIAVAVTRSRVGSLTLILGEEPLSFTDILLDDVSLQGSSLEGKQVSATWDGIGFSASGLSADLSGDIQLRTGIQWTFPEGGWAGRGTVRGTLAALEFDHTVTGPYPASAKGEVRLLHRIQPEIDAVVNWERWAFGEYILEDGEARVGGTTGEYAGEYDVSLLMPRVDSVHVTGTAAGNLQRLTAFDAHATSGSGDADLVGSLAWSPEFTAEARIRTAGFDPSPFIEELSGNLDAEFHLRIGSAGGIDISDAVVSGVLNSASIAASGTVAMADDQVRCGQCIVNVGDNRIDVDGFYGRGDDILTFEIAAPTLSELWPEFSGSIDGKGELTGAATNPRFTGELHGERLEFQHWSATEVVVISRASTLESFDLSAALTSFSVDETDLGSFTVTGKGTPESLDMVLAWDFRGLDINAEGNIRQRVDGVDGTITSASVTEPNTGRWSLQDQLEIGISGSDVSLSPHAWTGELGRLQVSRISSERDEVVLVAGIEGLPLQFANTFMPENLRLSGTASASIDVNRRDGQWSGSIDWKQANTTLRVLEANEQLTDVSIPKSELNIVLRDGGAHGSAAMVIEPGVSANLEVTFADLSRDSAIDAELQLEGKDWYWIPAVFPVLDNFEGAISATVNAAGPLLSPEFNGSLNWKDGSLAVPSLNVPVTHIDLTVAGSSAGAATVSGSAKAGEGDLSVNGRVENVMLPSRFVNMRVRGSTAEIINWPEYHLWGSPDLVVVGTREGWVFSGSFEVPRAEIAVKELSDEAVMPSPDVVVVGREQASAEAPTRIDGVAKLTLGDDVHVAAFGLDTKLRGDLQVRMFKDRPTSAVGRVTLVEGIFSAYGQKLSIQEGTLTFTGPLDNPIVDVRAVRVIEGFDGQVTAGIHLQGRAQQINSSVYSDPVMSEADALSYLVVGRPLSQATQSEGGELSSAALALGVRQAGRITDQIGQALGLDQLTVAGDGGDTTALVAGKQINSRLHARYAYGVFSRLGTLLLRYRLSKRLTLEAGAGEAESIDLLYLVEKE